MNKIYRIVWSTATSTWVVASEFAKGDARGAAMQCPPVRRRCLASIIAMLLGCAHPAWAQTVYWDGANTTANADGGAGTWQTGTTNWDDAATGGANTAWSDALDAVFGGSAGTVTIAAGGVTAHNLTFNPTNYGITGGTLTLSGTDPTITVNGTQATISSIIAGSDGLTKHGVGTLLVAATQSFDITDVHAGTLEVGADATYRSQATTVATGATLDVAGRFTGTEGDDTFASSGIVRGAFDFAAGNDRVYFTGGPNPPLQLDGGSGNDTLTFDAMDLGDDQVGQLQGWELVSLEHGTMLTLSTAIAGVDMLALDASSSIFARGGASLSGSLANDGAVHVDAARMAIGGGYAAGQNASLYVTVSPGSNTAGGLDIAGDVTGVTPVVFASDGSTGGSTASILVIDSPNDTRGNGGFTVAGSDDGMLRLTGSPFAWTFGQADDKRWYLDTDATVVMPEVAGYATLAAIGFDTTRTAQQALFGHLDGVRGTVDCDRDGGRSDGSHRFERKDCSGFWVSTIGTETRVGAGPGFAYSGDTYGLFVGADGTVHEDDAREIRAGAYAGMVEGNWWTSGASSGPIAASDANVRLEGPAFGAYGELLWSNGTYASTSIVQQRHDADVIANDGFRQRIDGSSASLVQQLGWKRAVENGWSLEPQLQLGVTKQQWHDVVDAGGKALTLHDDTLGHVRAALRVDRTVARDGGMWRPWLSVGLEDTFGEPASSVSVATVALPGEQVGQRWTFDAGVEATLHGGVSLFGALGLANELNGTSKETRQARIGVRWSW